MIIKTVPLSQDEKKVLKKVFLYRVLLGVLLSPLVGAIAYEGFKDFHFQILIIYF